jgi:hypothetical protein
MGIEDYQFEKGREKTGGRAKGTRNKISEAFLKDLHAEWEKSGAAVLKIMAVEQPGVFAGLVAKVLPTAFDDSYPTQITIITGVPRAGDPPPPPEYLNRPPQIPAAVPSLPIADDSNTDDCK